MAIAPNAHGAAAGIADQLTAALHHLKDLVARHKAVRETYRELNALSDRELADLGLNRSMIRQLALETAKAK